MSEGIQSPLIIFVVVFNPKHDSLSALAFLALHPSVCVWLSAHVWFQVPQGSSLSLPNGSERALQSQKDPEDLQLPPCF